MDWRITNIVITGNFGYAVDLYKLCSSEKNVEYDPEIFPGLKMKIGKATAIIFPKGKFNLTGIDKNDNLGPTLEELEKVCKNHKIGE